MEALEERIENLEKQVNYQEMRSRKYNLLFYGFPQSKGEDTEEIIRNFVKTEMNLGDSDNIPIGNVHRIPQFASFGKEPTRRPDAIIVKFIHMKDRDRILSATRNLKKGCKKIVRSDLPAELKKLRSELSTIAFEMRQKKHYQTRIRETMNKKALVWLEYRKDKNQEWEKYVK